MAGYRMNRPGDHRRRARRGPGDLRDAGSERLSRGEALSQASGGAVEQSDAAIHHRVRRDMVGEPLPPSLFELRRISRFAHPTARS